jgi:hypothetical protein
VLSGPFGGRCRPRALRRAFRGPAPLKGAAPLAPPSGPGEMGDCRPPSRQGVAVLPHTPNSAPLVLLRAAWMSTCHPLLVPLHLLPFSLSTHRQHQHVPNLPTTIFFSTYALFSSLVRSHSPNFPKLPKTFSVGMELLVQGHCLPAFTGRRTMDLCYCPRGGGESLSPATQYVKTHVDSSWSRRTPVLKHKTG